MIPLNYAKAATVKTTIDQVRTEATVSPPSATFANVVFPNANNSNRVNFKSNLFYEFCIYALGTGVMGESILRELDKLAA